MCVAPVMKGGLTGRAIHSPSFTSISFVTFNAVARWYFLMKLPTLERFYLISVYKNMI